MQEATCHSHAGTLQKLHALASLPLAGACKLPCDCIKQYQTKQHQTAVPQSTCRRMQGCPTSPVRSSMRLEWYSLGMLESANKLPHRWPAGALAL